MLILSRSIGKSLIIAGDAIITVYGVSQRDGTVMICGVNTELVDTNGEIVKRIKAKNGDKFYVEKYPEVCIHVFDIRGMQVRLGIDAPRNITVNRDEIEERSNKEVYKQEKDFGDSRECL